MRLAALLILPTLLGADAYAQQVTTYTYDVHGRVTGVGHPGSASVYTYDAADNRTGFTSTPMAGRSGGAGARNGAEAATSTSAADVPCPFVRITGESPSVLVRGVCADTPETPDKPTPLPD